MPDDEPAERTHEEADAEHGEGGKQSGRRVGGGEEGVRDGGGEEDVDTEVVPFENIADGRRGDGLSRLCSGLPAGSRGKI